MQYIPELISLICFSVSFASDSSIIFSNSSLFFTILPYPNGFLTFAEINPIAALFAMTSFTNLSNSSFLIRGTSPGITTKYWLLSLSNSLLSNNVEIAWPVPSCSFCTTGIKVSNMVVDTFLIDVQQLHIYYQND